MLSPVPPTDCMRAREGASARLDGELDQLESARLDAHLLACAECRAFLAEISSVARQLRGADLEVAPPMFVPAAPRRRVAMPVAAAAATVAVAIAAGSSFLVGRQVGAQSRAHVTATRRIVQLNHGGLLALLRGAPQYPSQNHRAIPLSTPLQALTKLPRRRPTT